MMETAQTFSVHVAAWQDDARLHDFSCSVASQTEKRVQVLLLSRSLDDVGGPDFSATFPFVVFLRQFQTLGYAQAHHRALEFAFKRWENQDLKHRYIVFSHPDVILAKESMRNLLQAFESDPNLIVAGPRILRAHVQAAPDTEALQVSLSQEEENAGWDLDRGRCLRVRRGVSFSPDAAPIEVFGLSDAFFLVRASAIQKLKVGMELFDTDFEEGSVTLDFFWRCHLFGMKVACVPQAVAWHHAHLHGSAGRNMDERLCGLGLVQVKNEQIQNFFFHVPWMVYAWGRILIRALFHPRAFFSRRRSLMAFPRCLMKRYKLRKRGCARASSMRRLFV